MADCVVPGCTRNAVNKIGVRLRRPDTSAIWAPNTDAFVCELHAYSGADLTVLYQPTETRQIRVAVHGATAAPRITPINQPEVEETIAETLVGRIPSEGTESAVGSKT
jgi:hypothetical protein